jgi:hypothetical protein
MLWLPKRTGRYRHVIATRVDLDRYLVLAMHRALSIEEIVAHIANGADTQSKWALARTCRAFTEPALDAVWAIATTPRVLARLTALAFINSENMWVSRTTDTEQRILAASTRLEALEFRSNGYRVVGVQWFRQFSETLLPQMLASAAHRHEHAQRQAFDEALQAFQACV